MWQNLWVGVRRFERRSSSARESRLRSAAGSINSGRHILESRCAQRCANDTFSTSFRATLIAVRDHWRTWPFFYVYLHTRKYTPCSLTLGLVESTGKGKGVNNLTNFLNRVNVLQFLTCILKFKVFYGPKSKTKSMYKKCESDISDCYTLNRADKRRSCGWYTLTL